MSLFFGLTFRCASASLIAEHFKLIVFLCYFFSINLEGLSCIFATGEFFLSIASLGILVDEKNFLESELVALLFLFCLTLTVRGLTIVEKVSD